jgi:hypothetical protein
MQRRVHNDVSKVSPRIIHLLRFRAEKASHDSSMTNCCVYTFIDLCMLGALNLHYIISSRLASAHCFFQFVNLAFV